MNWFLLIVGVIVLGVIAYFIMRNPQFWINLVKQIFLELLPAFLKAFSNRPKSEAEWKEWRELSSMKEKDMSIKQKARYKELKKLNSEFKK